jgi:hypothetical protein
MLVKKIKFLLIAFALGCNADYGVTTNTVKVEEIQHSEVHVDSFIQPSKPEQVDVLVLLDTSCSMNDNYNQVSTGVELLRNDLNAVTNDYNIAFINTSLMDPYFVGTFDNATPIIDFIIAPWTLGGDTLEAGFSALYDFTRVMPESVGFFRDTADKLFIFVSDEEEQSGIPVNVFAEWLKTEFAGVQRDIVSIVTVPDEESVCETPDYSSTVGQRYAELAQHYGKKPIDICSDWELWLSNSTFLIGPIDYIKLTYTPIQDSIKIYIDRFETQQWEYEEDTNTVHLLQTPSEGALIEAVYVKAPEEE